MTTRETFNLPVSDCGCFVAGEIGPHSLEPPPGEKPYPPYGVIVFYETAEAAREAARAAMDAHWSQADGAYGEGARTDDAG